MDNEHIERLNAMLDPKQQTWDLSPNDIKAIEYAVHALAAWQGALDRSPYDISPCSYCGEPVVCLPDGLPLCEPCHKKHLAEERSE